MRSTNFKMYCFRYQFSKHKYLKMLTPLEIMFSPSVSSVLGVLDLGGVWTFPNLEKLPSPETPWVQKKLLPSCFHPTGFIRACVESGQCIQAGKPITLQGEKQGFAHPIRKSFGTPIWPSFGTPIWPAQSCYVTEAMVHTAEITYKGFHVESLRTVEADWLH